MKTRTEIEGLVNSGDQVTINHSQLIQLRSDWKRSGGDQLTHYRDQVVGGYIVWSPVRVHLKRERARKRQQLGA